MHSSYQAPDSHQTVTTQHHHKNDIKKGPSRRDGPKYLNVGGNNHTHILMQDIPIFASCVPTPPLSPVLSPHACHPYSFPLGQHNAPKKKATLRWLKKDDGTFLEQSIQREQVASRHPMRNTLTVPTRQSSLPAPCRHGQTTTAQAHDDRISRFHIYEESMPCPGYKFESTPLPRQQTR